MENRKIEPMIVRVNFWSEIVAQGENWVCVNDVDTREVLDAIRRKERANDIVCKQDIYKAFEHFIEKSKIENSGKIPAYISQQPLLFLWHLQSELWKKTEKEISDKLQKKGIKAFIEYAAGELGVDLELEYRKNAPIINIIEETLDRNMEIMIAKIQEETSQLVIEKIKQQTNVSFPQTLNNQKREQEDIEKEAVLAVAAAGVVVAVAVEAVSIYIACVISKLQEQGRNK